MCFDTLMCHSAEYLLLQLFVHVLFYSYFCMKQNVYIVFDENEIYTPVSVQDSFIICWIHAIDIITYTNLKIY